MTVPAALSSSVPRGPNFGTFGGSRKDVPLSDIATLAVKTAIERSGVPAALIGHLAKGNVIPTEPRDAHLSRVAAMVAGCPKETPACNVNRTCGSGLQAITLGDCHVTSGAGAVNLCRSAYRMPGARWGKRMGDLQSLDQMNGAPHDPFNKIHMGITAGTVAEQFGITHLTIETLTAESHQCAAAIASGRF